jgi:hypothetical protein
MAVFGDVAPCNLVNTDLRFRGADCLCYQGDECYFNFHFVFICDFPVNPLLALIRKNFFPSFVQQAFILISSLYTFTYLFYIFISSFSYINLFFPVFQPTNQPTKKLTKGGVLRKRQTRSLARFDHSCVRNALLEMVQGALKL